MRDQNLTPAADIKSAASPGLPHCRQNRSTKPPLLVIWHLLSLDAPTVAVFWTIFTAAVTHTRLPLATPIAMALTVWTLYASDRLLDTRHLGSKHQFDAIADLEPRHLFHHRYRSIFSIAIVACALGLAALLPMLPPSAIRLYLTEGALLAGYFLLIHAAPQSARNSSLSFFSAHRIPKELLVGPFFAAAVFIPTVSCKPQLRVELLPLAILFAALCSLNCLYIYIWEHPVSYASHWMTAYSIRHLNGLTLLFLVASLLCSLSLRLLAHTPLSLQLYPFACATSALLLFAIHKLRRRFSSLTLRSAADAALLTPLLILPFVFWHRV